MSTRAPRDADVLIVGAGIAGLSAAYFAARAGRRVTVVDEGVHRASDLPIALINPLRGRNARLVADGIAGMHASFALIDALREQGHAVDAGRGLHRPLIGVARDATGAAWWTARIGDRLAFDWYEVAPATLGLVDDVPVLRLRDAGWVAPTTLLDALRIASGASTIVDRATTIVADGAGGGEVVLARGPRLRARTLLWCGGAWGASWLDGTSDGDAAYKPGSLLAVDATLTHEALSFGLYAAPWTTKVDGVPRIATLVGPTREDAQAAFPKAPMPDEALTHLGRRIAATFGSSAPPRAVWRGVRLVRLSSRAATALAGVATLTALGSRGFLMAPLQAAAWARSL